MEKQEALHFLICVLTIKLHPLILTISYNALAITTFYIKVKKNFNHNNFTSCMK